MRKADPPSLWDTTLNSGGFFYTLHLQTLSISNKIAPQSQWPQRLKTLLAENLEIPRNFMGFPENWEEHGVWK